MWNTRRPHPGITRGAFTLVELLVVVGIIALLLGVLMPAIGRARSAAVIVACASNLRQIGHAMVQYTNQSGYFPGWGAQTPGGDYMLVFPARLRLMLGGERGVFRCPGAVDDRFEWPAAPDWNTHKARASDTGYGYELNEPVLIDVVTPFSYGYNALAGDMDPSRGLGFIVNDPQKRFKEVKASRAKKPEELLAVADGNIYGGTLIVGAFYGPAGGTKIQEFHNLGSNALFCDGHVEWFRLDDLSFKPFDFSPEANARRRIWTIDNKP